MVMDIRLRLFLQIEGHDETVPGIFEADLFRVELVRIPIPDPFEKFYKLFFIFCIGAFLQFFASFKGFDTPIVARSAAAILRRSGKFSIDTYRVSGVFCFGEDLFECDSHLPVVSVIIVVQGLIGEFFEKILKGNFCREQPMWFHFPWLSPWAFDVGDIFTCSNPWDHEAMEMVVQPVHSILDSHVKVIKRVALRD